MIKQKTCLVCKGTGHKGVFHPRTLELSVVDCTCTKGKKEVFSFSNLPAKHERQKRLDQSFTFQKENVEVDLSKLEVVDGEVQSLNKTNQNLLEEKKELIDCLKKSNNCIKHARLWISNLKKDFKDNGMYKLCCNENDDLLNKLK